MPLYFFAQAGVGGDVAFWGAVGVLGVAFLGGVFGHLQRKAETAATKAEREADKAQRAEDRAALLEDRKLAIEERRIVAAKVEEVAVAAKGVAEKTDHISQQSDKAEKTLGDIHEQTNSRLTEVTVQVATLTDANKRLYEQLQGRNTQTEKDSERLIAIERVLARLMERGQQQPQPAGLTVISPDTVLKAEIVQPADKPVPVVMPADPPPDTTAAPAEE